METNVLYYGDNLDILRKHIPSDSVDLIYLDPPFNSKASYNVLFKEPTGEPSQAQIIAFEDTWHWTSETEKTFAEIIKISPSNVIEMMKAFRGYLHENDMTAYLTMMCIRLLELRRVLKESGAIYLHCDPTASHYLKILMDTIFGIRKMQNEIIWHYGEQGTRKKHSLAKGHETILYYSKGDLPTWHTPLKPYSERLLKTLKKDDKGYYYTRGSRTGRRDIADWEKESKVGLKTYVDLEKGGTAFDTVWDWTDVGSYPRYGESLGYETQKPTTLLERIIESSSNEGDIVLDPFCGCGTTLVAAERLKRKWIGIDITHLAIGTMKLRLNHLFPSIKYEVKGEPIDLAGAYELAKQNKYQFQWWSVSLVGGQPYGDMKKGADTGIDGFIYFMDEKDKVKKAIVQVKGGTASVSQVRDLIHVVHRESAEFGIFLTLEKPTKQMIKEAVSEGFYHSPFIDKDFSRIQILTIDELLHGQKPTIPPWVSPLQVQSVSSPAVKESPKML